MKGNCWIAVWRVADPIPAMRKKELRRMGNCFGAAAINRANCRPSVLRCHLLFDAQFDIVLVEGGEDLIEIAFHDAV